MLIHIAFSVCTFLSLAIATGGAVTPPALQLATPYHDGIDAREYLVSEKFDGVRGHWTGTRLLTRGGHTIHAPEWFTANWPAEPMDGELWIARGRFDDVSALVRSDAPEDARWREVHFLVFDLPAFDAPFALRARRIVELLERSSIAWLEPVRQFRVADRAALDARLAEVVAAGGEGLVLHHETARYRAGRSDALLKYKLHDDAEARVVGYIEGEGKYAGMVGALLVERPDGVRFRIGSGLDDADRANPPGIGSWVTYRYNGLTSGGLPRFARYLRVREMMPPPDPVN